jgi:hypothetical protein
MYRKTIYLAPEFVPGYLELAAVYEREEDTARARKMRQTALDLLQRLPAKTAVEPYDQLTAGELADSVRKMLAESAG